MKRIPSLQHSFILYLAVILPLMAFLSAGPIFAQNNDDHLAIAQNTDGQVSVGQALDNPVRDSLFGRADSLYVAGIEFYNNEDYLVAAKLFEQCDSLNKAGGREEPYYSGNAKSWAGNSYFRVGDTNRAMQMDALYYMLSPVDRRLTVCSDSLMVTANFYANNGDIEQALEYCRRCVEIEKDELGESHYYSIEALYSMSYCYYCLEEYEESVEYFYKALEIADSNNISIPYLDSGLYGMTYVCFQIKNYAKVLEFGSRAEQILLENIGEKNEPLALLLDLMSVSYQNLQDYQNALDYGTRSTDIYRELLGEHDPNYAKSLNILANNYRHLGEYEKAVELGTRAAELLEEMLGDRHPDYAIALHNLTIYYNDLCEYEKSLEIGAEAMKIRKEVLGERHPDYASTLNSLAWAYNGLGDYEKAIELGTETVEIRKEVLGERNLDYALSLGNLANYYSNLGNYEKSIELGTEAMKISKEVGGERNLDYALSLENLANYYYYLGEYDKAIELATEAMEIRREAIGDRHPLYASSLGNLASCYAALGNYDKATELWLEAMEIQKEGHPDYAILLGNQANCYAALGNYEKAIELWTEAAEILKEVLGERHPVYAGSASNLAGLYLGLNNYEAALKYILLSKNVYTENLRKNFSFLTTSERSLYWDNIKVYLENGIGFCIGYPSDESNELAYNVELLSKGILLSSEREFDKVIKESGDEELLAKFEQLRQDRLQLEVYYKKPVDERPADEVSRLEKEAEQLEKDLIAGSKEYGDFTRSLAIEWADVRDALRDNDVAIEFAKAVNYSERSVGETTDYYVALMLRKGWEAPKCVYLGTAEEFEPYLAMSNNSLYKSQEFSEKVWAGIVEAAELHEGDNVYFSPEGIFYQLGIEYLPVVGEDGEDQSDSSADRIMADKYNLRRLSSTKELCFEPSAVADDSAVLYGGLIYEANPGGEDSVEVATAEETKRDLTVGMLLAERGERSAEADSLMRDDIRYLPWTLAEADTLATMLADNHIVYEKYTGYRGTEESFKALTGNAPKLIHIATHGFYLSPTTAEIMSQQRHNAFLALGEDRQNNVIDYSMSRSGLLFSGSEPAWFGEPVPAGEDDGILTAQEIAGLDLRGVDLAVLSACSTAKGEITGDGVAGLQRGFKKAGVKTLLLTLWEVNDKATQLFMTNFYQNLISGETKRKAFEDAQNFLRTHEDWIEMKIDDPDGEPVYDDTIGDWVRPTKVIREWGKPYANPQFWAAFIMLD